MAHLRGPAPAPKHRVLWSQMLKSPSPRATCSRETDLPEMVAPPWAPTETAAFLSEHPKTTARLRAQGWTLGDSAKAHSYLATCG